MHRSINIDAAVEHIKNIVDSVRCTICDTSSGSRMRYACGHTSCVDCVLVVPECSVCLTPLQRTSRAPVLDLPLSQYVENVVNLLNVFQNEFHVDVYRRQRISEQLKVEKDLFPECIQAPAKYTNKRKSYKYSQKENRLSQLPGEEISSVWRHKMEQSNGNVERWLKKYVRKPFADLNSNDERLSIGSSSIKKQQIITNIENVTVQSSTRKRDYLKALSDTKNKNIDKHLTPVKKKYHKKPKIENKSSNGCMKKCNSTKITVNNESGIDEEPVIVIDDSQSIKVDKDLNAWLAVLEAEKNKQNYSVSLICSKSSKQQDNVERQTEEMNATTNLTTKVPFFLKGYLSEKCIHCNEVNKDKSNSETVESKRDVSVTVENNSFIVFIEVANVDNNKTKAKNGKQSVKVQTDISESWSGKGTNDNINILNHDQKIIKESTPIPCDLQNRDVLKDNINDAHNLKESDTDKIMSSHNKTGNVIIDESDSDEDFEPSLSLEVTADIHRSCEETDYGVLADVENQAEHNKRPRRTARGYTPTSTDSSEKENFNPNRKRKTLTSKKKTIKK